MGCDGCGQSTARPVGKALRQSTMSLLDEFFGDPLKQSRQDKEIPRTARRFAASSNLPSRALPWNRGEHTDEENLKWCWLRAVEWGRWPIFLSQPIAPVLLMFLPWQHVVIGVTLLNVLWAVFVRYHMVALPLAYWGAVFVLLRWIAWPCATAWMFISDRMPEAWVTLSWPVLIYPLGIITPTQVGRIQKMLMECLGYETTA